MPGNGLQHFAAVGAQAQQAGGLGRLDAPEVQGLAGENLVGMPAPAAQASKPSPPDAPKPAGPKAARAAADGAAAAKGANAGGD